jgi:hypothetical protein
MDAQAKKAAENQRLEFAMDSFPLSADQPDHSVFLRYTKYEYPERSRMNFYKKPDFIVPDIFFDVMNGKIPEQEVPKLKFPNPK